MTMTAPDGAYIIGGGRYHFGQAMTEDLARAAFEFPLPTLGNMIELLRSVLEQLPLDALKPFQGFLGIPDNLFGNIVDAVNAIISSLQNRPVFMLLADFTTWVADFIKAITGTVTSGNLADLTVWFQQNVVDKIANLGTEIQNILTKIIEFVTHGELFTAIAEVVEKIVQAITGSLGGFDDLKNWITGTLSPVIDGFTALIAGIISLFGGSGLGVTDALTTLRNWLDNIFTPVVDDLAAIIKRVSDFIAAIAGVFGGAGGTIADAVAAVQNWMDNIFKPVADGLAEVVGWLNAFFQSIASLFGGSGGTVTDALDAISNWLTTVFSPVKDGLAALVQKVQDLFDGIWRLFTGNATGVGKDLTATLDAISSWLNTVFKPVKDGLTAVVDTVQKLLDALFGAFGGVAGTDKTIADVIGAITGWFTGVFQKLIDGINALAALIPGFTTGTNPIQNAVDIIAGILGIGQAAEHAAAQANMGVEAILTGQAGGFVEEFDVAASSTLSADWKKQTSLADGYGTDGAGSAVFKVSGTGVGQVMYTQTTKPLVSADMKVTTSLSKRPTWDLLVRSAVYLSVQANPSNQECYRVAINNTGCQFQKVSTSGADTDIGAEKPIPGFATGVPYALEIKGNTLTLYRQGIAVATQAVSGPLTGRNVGFGAYKPAYVGGQPCANFAGFTWQTV